MYTSKLKCSSKYNIQLLEYENSLTKTRGLCLLSYKFNEVKKCKTLRTLDVTSVIIVYR